MSRTSIGVIYPKPDEGFVETPPISALTDRAIRYRNAGYPVHLSGPTGCGKTTLALHIANRIGRPVVLINGDEEFHTSSLVGGQLGYRWRRVVDNYVSRVYKSEESMSRTWEDERVTAAAKYGFTLLYNEFTRSRPEANNALLSVFEEGILELPYAYGNGRNYIMVHPEFSAILTSNPEEYAGVFRSQDALLDRMITIDMGYFDEDTEAEITRARSGIRYDEARKIVRLVRRLRGPGLCETTPTLRSSIIIARTAKDEDGGFQAKLLRQVCIDVLSPKIGKGKTGDADPINIIDKLLSEEGFL